MSTLVLVHRTDAVKALSSVAPLGAKFVAVPPVEPQHGMSWVRAEGYLDRVESRTIEHEALRGLKSVLHQPAQGEKSLHRLLQMGPVSLWWFIEASFHRSTFKHVVRHISWLLNAVEREGVSRFTLVDDSSLFARTVIAVGHSKKVEVVTLPWGALKKGRQHWHETLAKPAFGIARDLRDKLRQFMNAFFPTNGTTPPGMRAPLKILLASAGREQVTTDLLTGRRTVEDLILAPVLQALSQQQEVQATFLYKFLDARRLRVPSLPFRGHLRVIVWESYLNSVLSKAIWKEMKRLEKIRRDLWAEWAFQNLWMYKGVELWPVVAAPLQQLWNNELGMAVRYMALSEQIMKRERPNLLIVASETSLDNKALVAMARSRGIPVVAMQHGTIIASDDYLVDFSADRRDLEKEPCKAWFYPDRFCAFGVEARRVMVEEAGYPYPERIAITGQPRFDVIFHADQWFDRHRFCLALGIDSSKKIVLIGSQTFNIAGNKEDFFRAVLSALKNQNDVAVIIKPHPLEDPAWHKRISRRLGVTTIVLPQNANMQEALFACDLLVTFYSTVAIEAMLMGRPVITVNLTGEPDPSPYSKEGAAFGVCEAKDFPLAVQRALYDVEARHQLVERARIYALREVKSQDGKATERLLTTALELTRQNRE